MSAFFDRHYSFCKTAARVDHYLLDTDGSRATKIHGGQKLEIKTLLGQGLSIQLGSRQFTRYFPLASEVKSHLLRAFPQAEFAIGDLSDPECLCARLKKQVRICPVSKRRRPYRIDGCKAEVTEVDLHRSRCRAVAVEGVDPEIGAKFVDTVNLSVRKNADYGIWLKHHLHAYSVRSTEEMFYAPDGAIGRCSQHYK